MSLAKVIKDFFERPAEVASMSLILLLLGEVIAILGWSLSVSFMPIFGIVLCVLGVSGFVHAIVTVTLREMRLEEERRARSKRD